MPSAELERLAERGLLEREPPIRSEFDGLVRQAETLLGDARHDDLSLESRFQIAYGAAYALALASLRALGYRPRNRQIVFQALAHTAGTPAATWRMLARAHEQRNRREYEGAGEITETLVRDILTAAETLIKQVRRLREKL